MSKSRATNVGARRRPAKVEAVSVADRTRVQTVKLTDDEHLRLSIFSSKKNLSKQDILVAAMTEYLDSNE